MNIAKSQHYSGEIILDDPGKKWENKKQKMAAWEDLIQDAGFEDGRRALPFPSTNTPWLIAPPSIFKASILD